MEKVESFKLDHTKVKDVYKRQLLNLIPTNPLNALAEGNMLQIIIFSLIVGVILAKLGKKVEAVSYTHLLSL